METKVERLPSGKILGLTVFPDGSQEEIHRYGDTVSILYRIEGGVFVSECYMDGHGFISRRKYEELIEKYSDMPAAGKAKPLEIAVKRAISDGHKRWKKEFSLHRPDMANGKRMDEICLAILKAGALNLQAWLDLEKKQLPGIDRKKSMALIRKLSDAGAENIFLTEIEFPEGEWGVALAGGLVFALPDNSAQRFSILSVADKLAREFGFDGPLDDGQRLVYLRFS